MRLHRLPRTAITLGAVLLVCACKDEAPAPEAAEDTSVSMSSDSLASETPTEAVIVAEGRDEKISNDLYEFEYSYPAVAAQFPSLKAALDRRLIERKQALEKESRDDKKSAEADGYPYRPHSSGTAWKVVTDLPDWLSLSAEGYVYSGGAHGMSLFNSLLWDKQASVARKPVDLFTSASALDGAIRTPFCDALNLERSKRRQEPVDPNSGNEFDACINPLESTVILGSSNGATFDRIGILVGPYEAGAYAEGTYEITLPVTPAVMATLKPAFRSSFSPGQ